MRQFFETYQPTPKLVPLVRELSWTHNLLIMSRSKREEAVRNKDELLSIFVDGKSQAAWV